MENKSHAIAAGIFVVSVMAILMGLAVWLTRDQGSYQTYEMTTSQAVTGLQSQAPVRYKGVSVGKVVYIGFDPAVEGNVLIRVTVDETTPITSRTYATLGYQGVTGLAYIDLDDATIDLPALGQTGKGHQRIGMRPSNLSQLAAMGPEVIGDVRETMSSINALLNDKNRDDLMLTVRSFGEAARSSAQLMQNMDQSLNKNIEPLLAQLSKDLGTGMQAMQKAARGIEEMSQEVTLIARQLNSENGAVAQLGDGIKAFTSVAQELNNGTLPRLQQTMGTVTASMQSIDSLAQSITSNPQAFLYGNQSDGPGPGEAGYRSGR